MPEGSISALYVLHGPDEFLRDQHRRRLIDQIVGDADHQLAVAGFDAEAELADVLDELRTAPLLAGHRAVVVRQGDAFVTNHAAALTRYLAKASSTGTLVLIVDAWKASSRSKEALRAFADLDRAARAVGEFIPCSPPEGGQLLRWIVAAAKERGKRMAREAAGLLAAWSGTDLARLDSEIEKLSLYVGSQDDISPADVGAAVAATTSPAPFRALPNAIESRRIGKALTELATLMTARGEEFRVLGMVAWHLRQRSGAGGRGRGASAGKLQKDFRHVLAADLAIKTGADPLTTMQMLVTRLCL